MIDIENIINMANDEYMKLNGIEEENIEGEDKSNEEKKQVFKLPIEYIQPMETTESLLTDLELLETKSSETKPIYELLFDPKTLLGKDTIHLWSKYYTNNSNYIKDSQYLLKNIDDIPFEKHIIENAYFDWKEIKDIQQFKERFQYIEWTRFLFLNKNASFMLFLSALNISSPLMQLLAPLLMLILPFFFIKILGMPVSLDSYIQMLKKVLKNNSIVQLITNFWSAPINQKMYIIITVGLYFYNLYQNFLSCYQFYKNAYYILEKINRIKKYMDYTIQKMMLFSKKISKLSKYNDFNKTLIEYRKKLEILYKLLDYVPEKCGCFRTIKCYGKIMKDFYNIYYDEEWNDIMSYSFGFNGYIDNLIGIRNKYNIKQINPIKLTNRNKFKLYNLHHPIIEDKPVKNSINMKKSIILTGPNAAGKTTMLKATIINLLLSQQIGFGYYKKGVLNPYDYIHCYINIPDDCSRDSLFQSEVRRCKDFLDIIKDNPNKRHFCVFDELFSGTNPYEAISSAYGYLNHMVKNKKIKFLLTTHFIKLCKLFSKHKKIKNFNMNTKIINDKANYTYKMIKGVSETKGGISVLKDLKYPSGILKDAKNILHNL